MISTTDISDNESFKNSKYILNNIQFLGKSAMHADLAFRHGPWPFLFVWKCMCVRVKIALR